MTLLLDTHVLVWWLADAGDLSAAQSEAIERAETAGNGYGLAAISLWELAKLAELGRIELRSTLDALFEEIESHPAVHVLPLTPRIALESTRLGRSFHRDPADQLIVATARVHGLRLVTADERIRKSGVVGIV